MNAMNMFLEGNSFPTIVASLSKPNIRNERKSITHGNKYSSIGSIVLVKDFKFSDSVMEDLLIGMKSLNEKIFHVVMVVKSDEKYSDENKQVYEHKYYGDGSSFNLSVLIIDFDHFFKGEYSQIMTVNDYKSHLIFAFVNVTWFEIVTRSQMCNIDINGGMESKRHLLSFGKINVFKFLMCLQRDINLIAKTVIESFHETDKTMWRKEVDFRDRSVIEVIKNHGNVNDPDKKYDTIRSSDRRKKYKSKKENPFRTQKREFSSVLIRNNNSTRLNNGKSIQLTLTRYLEDIRHIINKHSDKKEGQKLIEETWADLLANKLLNNKSIINEQQGQILRILLKAKNTFDIMESHNFFKNRYPKLGNSMNSIHVLINTFAVCSTLYNRMKYNALVYKVGNDALYFIYKQTVKNNKGNDKFICFKDYKNKLDINLEDIVRLGEFYISILCTFPHMIFERVNINNSFYTKEAYNLRINEEMIEEIKSNVVISPSTLPMICEPNEWSDTEYGGFLDNESRENDLITGSENHKHTIANRTVLYKTINKISKTRFGINTLLLDYLRGEGNYLLKSIPAENILQRDLTLQISDTYRDIPIYLNVHADWRGRLYTQSFFISYQSGDLNNALLNFWEGESIESTGKYYLYIHGANNHNMDNISKESFITRIKWVKDNYEKIIFLDKDLILSAENPFIFTAFCLNLRELHNNPKYPIKTPVFLDATCSGIQHLSALLKDLELGTHVNLNTLSELEKPKDIYNKMVNPINEAINKFGEENVEYSLLSLVKFNRKILKRSIMTKVYNVSRYGISQQLQESLDSIEVIKDIEKIDRENIERIQNDLEKTLKPNKSKRFIVPGIDGKNVYLNHKDLFQIAKIINDQIFVLYPSLNSIYNYFIDIAKLMSKLKLVLTWITPSGLKITQHYLKTKKRVIAISMFGKTKRMIYREWENKLDTQKQNQAIIPNIIHSLDASHLMNLINSSIEDRLEPIITIHDCFGTLPNRMDKLDHRVKKEFILLYSQENFLKTFHERVLQSIRDNQYTIQKHEMKNYVLDMETSEFILIPNLPKLGKLDLENIINSRYMIS